MLITREHLVPQCWKCCGVGASACFPECFGMTIELPGDRVCSSLAFFFAADTIAEAGFLLTG